MYCWRFLLSISVFSYVAEFAIVGAQSPDGDYYIADPPPGEIDSLKRELAKSLAEIEKLKADVSSIKSGTQKRHGTSYIRWGRKTCEGNAKLVYEGHAAGPHHGKGGGGSNFLCMPEDPQWKNFRDGDQSCGRIAGVQYQLYNSGTNHNNIFSERNNGGHPLLYKPVACAVCYVGGRSSVLMIPAKTECPRGWTTEYWGYLVSDYSGYPSRHRSSYVCMDEAPEVAVGGIVKWHSVIYPVEAECGILPCSVYTSPEESLPVSSALNE